MKEKINCEFGFRKQGESDMNRKAIVKELVKIAKEITSADDFLIKVSKEVRGIGKESATIDYSLYTGGSMPSQGFNIKAKDRFEFEEEVISAVKKIFNKYEQKKK